MRNPPLNQHHVVRKRMVGLPQSEHLDSQSDDVALQAGKGKTVLTAERDREELLTHVLPSVILLQQWNIKCAEHLTTRHLLLI
jgi:hypothetical protein